VASCVFPLCRNTVSGFALICDVHKVERQAECNGYIRTHGNRVPSCVMPAHREHFCTPAWVGGRCKPCGERCCFCGAVHQYEEVATV
jgi:hypothetical protein